MTAEFHTVLQEQVEHLLQKLFDLHDLKANGVLEEEMRVLQLGVSNGHEGYHQVVGNH